MRSVYVCALWLFSVSLAAAQTEATLKVGARSYTTSDLLKRPELERVTVDHDPAYGGRSMRYQAIRAARLFEESNLHEDEVMQFRCLDGFVATISKERIMRKTPGQSVAYIAIENPKSKWPDLPIKSAAGSAGPFYLVWLNPELSDILSEEWPYQIAAFEVKGSLQRLYPLIFPKRNENAQVIRGLKLFQQTCFACHTMNHEGPAQVGPDLNLPLNPTEYFKEEILPLYIRNPQSIRAWEGSKMPGFGLEIFSHEDVTDLLIYLKEMALEKRRTQ